MKKLVLITLIIAITLFSKVNAQITFQKSYGTTNSLALYGTNDVTVMPTNDGNYCVAGTINTNNGDFYLMKVNSTGDTIWTKTYGGNFDDLLWGAQQTADSGFILAGRTRSFSMGISDAYLIKTDKNGNLIWSKNYGGFDWDWFSSVQQTSDGGYIACGAASSIGLGQLDVFLVKVSPIGNIIWSKTLGGSDWDYGCYVQQTFDGGFIITGATQGFTAASDRIYVVKTDSSGLVSWSKIFGGVMGEEGHCVKQCSDSGFIVTGYTNSFGVGSQDVFLLKVNKTGSLQWMKTYGGAWEDWGYYVEQTTDNGFIVVGRTESFGPGSGSSRNVYLLKTNAVGDTLWTKTYGSIINNGYYVKRTTDGGYIIASSPGSLSLIKTDSLGHSGCNEYGTATLVNSVTPIILTGANTNAVGAANTAATITRYTPITIYTNCSPTGIKDLAEEKENNVYPNPFYDKINITTNRNELVEISLYDVTSRKVFNQLFINSTSINTTQLVKGIYIYEVRDKNGLCKKGKLVKD